MHSVFISLAIRIRIWRKEKHNPDLYVYNLTSAPLGACRELELQKTATRKEVKHTMSLLINRGIHKKRKIYMFSPRWGSVYVDFTFYEGTCSAEGKLENSLHFGTLMVYDLVSSEKLALIATKASIRT
jgi:hypothetical protein